jgi:hypothetical protein
MNLTAKQMRERANNLPVRINKLWVRNMLVSFAAEKEENAKLRQELTMAHELAENAETALKAAYNKLDRRLQMGAEP